MIAPNGHIKVINYSSDYDADGLPVQNCERIGTAIPCNYSLNSGSKTYTENASLTKATYTVLVDDDISAEVEYIKMYGKFGDLGTFKVMSIESLDAVGCVKLIVERYAN